MRLNIIVGRFQPFHNEHVRFIDCALSESNEPLILLVGCSAEDGKAGRNPFTYEERLSVLEKHYASYISTGQLFIHPLQDHADDNVWLSNIETILEAYPATASKLFYVVDKDYATVNNNNLIGQRYDIKRIKIQNDLSSTHIRGLLLQGIISKDIPLATRQFLLKKYYSDYTCDEIRCQFCNSLMRTQVKEVEVPHETVYTFLVKRPELICTSCGISIITPACLQIFNLNVKDMINRLYYN